MKIITVMETAYSPRALYSKATTRESRALVGYMVRNGCTDNTILGGALALLRDIEDAAKENHVYQLHVETQYGDEIVSVVDMVRSGKLNKFTMTKRQIRKNKNLMRMTDK